MDRGKPSLIALSLINIARAKSATIPTILESSKPSFEDFFHFSKFDEMLKTIFFKC
jgi:hypothetical protein